jgi:hypothetical protein
MAKTAMARARETNPSKRGTAKRTAPERNNDPSIKRTEPQRSARRPEIGAATSAQTP